MSATGLYELTLECDEQDCGRKQIFIDDTRAQAKATARYDGWLIGKHSESYCPTHRERPRKKAA